MAFYTNNSNTGNLCVVKNDEFMVCDLSLTSENSIIFDKLKDLKAEDAEETPEKSKALASDVFKVNCVAISTCCNYLCAANSLNCLLLWKRTDDKWNLCSSRSLIRKGQKLIFTNSGCDIIIADRGGDIFSYSTKDVKEKAKFLLGHICLVLDLAISPDDKFLASCDRDGKIKISHYPNAYNIVAYCLGHQEFVSSIQFLQLSGCLSLLSSSGDGSVRLWQQGKNWLEKNSLILCENESLGKKSDVSDRENGDKSNSKTIESGNLVSEKQIEFSVRCIKYYSKLSLCLILFHFKPDVAVFKISDDGSIQFKQLLNLPGNPLDVVVCSDDKLIVLVKNLENVKLTVFNYSEEQIFTLEETEKIPLFLREFYRDFSCADAFSDDFVALFKRCYDTSDENDQNVSKKKK